MYVFHDFTLWIIQFECITCGKHIFTFHNSNSAVIVLKQEGQMEGSQWRMHSHITHVYSFLSLFLTKYYTESDKNVPPPPKKKKKEKEKGKKKYRKVSYKASLFLECKQWAQLHHWTPPTFHSWVSWTGMNTPSHARSLWFTQMRLGSAELFLERAVNLCSTPASIKPGCVLQLSHTHLQRSQPHSHRSVSLFRSTFQASKVSTIILLPPYFLLFFFSFLHRTSAFSKRWF